MQSIGDAVHLLIPSPSKRRTLYRGEITQCTPTGIVARFEDAIAPAVNLDVNIYFEDGGKFFQQGAVVTEIQAGAQPVITLRRAGPVVSAESRQTYRVCVIGSEFMAKLDKGGPCPVVDISPEGFAAIVPGSLEVGSVAKIILTADGRTVETVARIQSVKELPDKRRRYGFLVPETDTAARKAIAQTSLEAQRRQLKRVRRGAA